jgi:hypothetical protein
VKKVKNAKSEEIDASLFPFLHGNNSQPAANLEDSKTEKRNTASEQHYFDAQFCGKIAQIKRLWFSAMVLMKRRQLFCFPVLIVTDVFREICLAENSNVVRASASHPPSSSQFVNENLIKRTVVTE